MAHDRPRPRLVIFLASAGFCVLLFAARLVYEVPGGGLGLLYVVPIVLVAQEYGRTCGIVAGSAALPLWIAGGMIVPAELGVAATGIRVVIFLLVGRLTGAMADRLRADAHYFEVSRDLLCTATFDGYFRRINGSWEQTLIWTSAELLARPFVDPFRRPATDRGGGRAHRLRCGHCVLHQPLPHEGRRIPLDRVVLTSRSPA